MVGGQLLLPPQPTNKDSFYLIKIESGHFEVTVSAIADYFERVKELPNQIRFGPSNM